MPGDDSFQPEISLDQFGKGIYEAILNRLSPVVVELLSRDAGPPNQWERDYKLALLYFLSKSLKTYQAIGCLWRNGFDQDASALSRTLFEIVLQCEWLRVNPKKHATRFQEHAATISYASFLKVSRLADSGVSGAEDLRDKLKSAPEFSAWKAQYEHFATRYGKKGAKKKVPYNWWGDRITDLVDLLLGAGVSPTYLTEEYNYAYTLESALVHSSALRDQDYVERYQGGLKLHYYPEAPTNASVLLHAIRRVLRVASIVNEAWRLGFDAQIADDLAVAEQMFDPKV